MGNLAKKFFLFFLLFFVFSSFIGFIYAGDPVKDLSVFAGKNPGEVGYVTIDPSCSTCNDGCSGSNCFNSEGNFAPPANPNANVNGINVLGYTATSDPSNSPGSVAGFAYTAVPTSAPVTGGGGGKGAGCIPVNCPAGTVPDWLHPKDGCRTWGKHCGNKIRDGGSYPCRLLCMGARPCKLVPQQKAPCVKPSPTRTPTPNASPIPTLTPTPVAPLPWIKLKDTSFISSHALSSLIPLSPVAYDSDDDGSTNFIVGKAGVVTASEINITTLNQNAKTGVPEYKAISSSDSSLSMTPALFLSYVKARKEYKVITDLNEINKSGTYLYDGDLTIDSSFSQTYNVVLISTCPTCTMTIGRVFPSTTFAPIGSVAIVATNIVFSDNLTQADGVFIADNINTGTNIDQGLKIVGNLVA